MTASDLTCKELVELVTEYFEGTLPPNDRVCFEQHLTTCDGCTAYLDQMRRTIELVGQLTEELISPQAQQELLQIFQDWKKD